MAWSSERFPLENGVVILLVTALCVLYGRALTHDGPIRLGAKDLGALVALWSYFLLLRVSDEHKDFDRDLLNHPGRVLQSGQIELRHLRVLGAMALVVQAVVSVLADGGIGPVTVLWLVLMAWTLLMLEEFFLEWPPERFVAYAFLHMISMPLAFLWLAQVGADGSHLTPGTRWLVLLGGLIGAAMEVARKFRAPADERTTIDTYTSRLGVRGASVALSALHVLAAAVTGGLIAATLDASAAVYVGVAAAIVPGVAAAVRFARNPDPDRAARVDSLTGLSVVLLILIALISLLAAQGVA
jgi:4-hydroxybenzoate polyprenyltransferase